MNRHTAFPLSFVVTGKHLLLVGGGEGGLNRLITALLFDWARITITGPDITAEIEDIAALDERVTVLQRRVIEEDVEDVHLVIESTLYDELAESLAKWCRARRIPINAMDKLDQCDVYYPALILRGPLVLAICSNGEAPALTSTLRKLLEQRIGPGWCNAGMLMAEARRKLPRGKARMEMLKSLAVDERMLNFIADNDLRGMRELIDDAVCRQTN